MKTLFLLLIISIIATAKLNSESKDADESYPKVGFVPAPVVVYLPETGFAGGVAAYLFRQASEEFLPDELFAYALYSVKKQFVFQTEIFKYLDTNNYYFYSDIKFTKFPDLFYGIGSHTRESDEESFDQQTARFELNFLKNIAESLYLGTAFYFEKFKMLSVKEGGKLDETNIIGDGGTTVSGLGFAVAYDTRDNNFYTENGVNLQANYRVFTNAIGSKTDFWKSDIDASYYHGFGNKRVLAFNSMLSLSDGYVPFQLMPKLGGTRYLRGFYDGRYKDKYSFSMQTEYRSPIPMPIEYLNGRVGGVVFVGIGSVAKVPKDFFVNPIKPAYGLGLRFAIKKDDYLLIRFDVAHSESGFNYYFNVKEAF